MRTRKPFIRRICFTYTYFFSAIDNMRNIECKLPDINRIYRYVLKTVATNVNRDFVETTVTELVIKNLIFNKQRTKGLGL